MITKDYNRILDGLAFIGVGGSLMHILPPVAAALSIIWIGMQMYTWIINKRWYRDS